MFTRAFQRQTEAFGRRYFAFRPGARGDLAQAPLAARDAAGGRKTKSKRFRLALKGSKPALVMLGALLASPAAAQMSCLSVRHSGGVTYLCNLCGDDINVRWEDNGYCSSGCMQHVSAGGRASVTGWQGQTTYQVCWNYDYPKVNGNQFTCE